jgi:hypothetical protein
VWIYWIIISLKPEKGRLVMNSILVIIIGIPLAAAIAIATSLPILFVAGSLFLGGLWLDAGNKRPA